MKQDQSTQLPVILGQEHTATCIAAIFPTPNFQYLLTEAQVANYSQQTLSIEKKRNSYCQMCKYKNCCDELLYLCQALHKAHIVLDVKSQFKNSDHSFSLVTFYTKFCKEKSQHFGRLICSSRQPDVLPTYKLTELKIFLKKL